MRGIELGYRYAESPIIDFAGDERSDGYAYLYVPSALPGYRLPHVWLHDGSALHDRLGDGFTVLALGSTAPASAGLEAALRATGAPVTVLRCTEPAPRQVYGHDLLLIRPDLHVAWASDSPPADPAALAALITGRG